MGTAGKPRTITAPTKSAFIGFDIDGLLYISVPHKAPSVVAQWKLGHDVASCNRFRIDRGQSIDSPAYRGQLPQLLISGIAVDRSCRAGTQTLWFGWLGLVGNALAVDSSGGWHTAPCAANTDTNGHQAARLCG
jgi:hypothetical protein